MKFHKSLVEAYKVTWLPKKKQKNSEVD